MSVAVIGLHAGGAREIIGSGAAKTPFLRFGDRVRIESLRVEG